MASIAGRADAVLAVVAEAGHDARLVVVVPVQAVPPDVGQTGLPPPERRLEVAQVERPGVPLVDAVVEAHVLELEDHVDLAAGGVGEVAGLGDRDAGHLADRQRGLLAPGEHLPVHLLQELVDARPADVRREAVAVRPVAARPGRRAAPGPWR